MNLIDLGIFSCYNSGYKLRLKKRQAHVRTYIQNQLLITASNIYPQRPWLCLVRKTVPTQLTVQSFVSFILQPFGLVLERKRFNEFTWMNILSASPLLPFSFSKIPYNTSSHGVNGHVYCVTYSGRTRKLP